MYEEYNKLRGGGFNENSIVFSALWVQDTAPTTQASTMMFKMDNFYFIFQK
jgi:hypothetical protein